jgi:pimeloyl-ACP methyl ester carboxylesterase
MKPAAKQPAKFGPILLHCGGPGSDATCAIGEVGPASWLEVNSSAVVGPALSEDYDYWSISQRGMGQNLTGLFEDSKCPFEDEAGQPISAWPEVSCSGIDHLLRNDSKDEIMKRLGGDLSSWSMVESIRGGPGAEEFGNPYYNETYVRWAYRLVALESNLCFEDPKFKLYATRTNRSYNTLNYCGTNDLAHDIEVFRQAIGALKMSVYGVSYGTKVGSVYATIFPDKVHRLILDGDMGSNPDIEAFGNWVGESAEAVWTGLAESCDNSVMAGGSPETDCVAGPGVTGRLLRILKDAHLARAVGLLMALETVLYQPAAACAPNLMKCISDLDASANVSGNVDSCFFFARNDNDVNCPGYTWTFPLKSMRWKHLSSDLATDGAVLGLDIAGRFTEESFLNWWGTIKDKQPLGVTRSLTYAMVVGSWPALPKPQPPVGNPDVAPLVIGNLFDGQTPYSMAQRMLIAFPSGRLLTSQFYGHGLQAPTNYTAVVTQYEEEIKKGLPLSYTSDVAKLLCVKVALEYLKSGTLPRHHICQAPGPKQTWPGVTTSTTTASQPNIVI